MRERLGDRIKKSKSDKRLLKNGVREYMSEEERQKQTITREI